mmetsp:Transcript_3906/g.12112  ORF Transcript_3906/g.12112 Transcript_3906/m.12112 type:complete len:243 (-) Transcript_3906:1722-2450(-)
MPIASHSSSSAASLAPLRTHERQKMRATRTRTPIPGSMAPGAWSSEESRRTSPPREAHSTGHPSRTATATLRKGSCTGRCANRNASVSPLAEEVTWLQTTRWVMHGAAASETASAPPTPAARPPSVGTVALEEPLGPGRAGGGGAERADTATEKGRTRSPKAPRLLGVWGGLSPSSAPSISASSSGGLRKKSVSCSNTVGRPRARYRSCGHSALKRGFAFANSEGPLTACLGRWLVEAASPL